MGIEPTTFCLASKRSTPELHPHDRRLTVTSRVRITAQPDFLERIAGVEPALSEWKSGVLP